MRSLTDKNIRDRRSGRIPAGLPLDCVNLLTQVRETIDIEDLVISIYQRGQDFAGAAAALTATEAAEYVRQWNRIHGTSHTFEELVSVKLFGEVRYIILIAGHRRFHACVEIRRQINARILRRSQHFDGRYYAQLRTGIGAVAALELQFNENRHMAVPPHEEARKAWRFWRFLQRIHPHLSVASFGRRIGRSPEWVRDALHFCDLPAEIQAYANGEDGKPRLAYGILVQLARMDREHRTIMGGKALPPDVCEKLLLEAVAKKLSVKKFRERVDQFLDHLRQEASGQLTLFGGGVSSTAVSTRPVRKVVGEQVVEGLHGFVGYLRLVKKLLDGGKLGESPFTPIGTAREYEQYSLGSPCGLMAKFSRDLPEVLQMLAQGARAQLKGRHGNMLDGAVPDAQMLHGLAAMLSTVESGQYRRVE